MRTIGSIEGILRYSGRALAGLRRESGLSQEDLADIAGIHRNTVGNIERGDCDPSAIAVGMLQICLRCKGIAVGEKGFSPLGAGQDRRFVPFDALSLRPSTMVSMMGEAARARRAVLGLSMAALARDTGIHLNTIWNFEQGLVTPSLSTLFLIYRGLEVRTVAGEPDSLLLL
jgi:transcriptional regulator with XRE-family HTH domain